MYRDKAREDLVVKCCGTPTGPAALDNGSTSVAVTVKSKTHMLTMSLKLLLYHKRGVRSLTLQSLIDHKGEILIL